MIINTIYNSINKMDLLEKEFEFANFTYSEINDTLTIIGPRDEKYNFKTFLCAYRSKTWNYIPNTTKVIFKDMMIEKKDNKLGGDMWCVRWLIEYFGSNFSFENCYYAYFSGTIDEGKYIITNLVSTNDIF